MFTAAEFHYCNIKFEGSQTNQQHKKECMLSGRSAHLAICVRVATLGHCVRMPAKLFEIIVNLCSQGLLLRGNAVGFWWIQVSGHF